MFDTIINQLIVSNGAQFMGANDNKSFYITKELLITLEKYRNGRSKSVTIEPNIQTKRREQIK